MARTHGHVHKWCVSNTPPWTCASYLLLILAVIEGGKKPVLGPNANPIIQTLTVVAKDVVKDGTPRWLKTRNRFCG